MERVAFQPGGKVGFADAALRFVPGQGLHIRQAVEMGRIHDLERIRPGDKEDALQDGNDKIHGRDIIVMEHHPVERLQRRLGGADDFRGGGRF